MKDDTSTPTPDGGSSNEFESDRPGTKARDAAEAAIEDLRRRGGVFVEAVRATRMAMALTDPSLPGNPIIFANKAFLRLSGYRMEEVLGQQPHFMNGPDTDRKDAARFAEAIRADQDDIIETVQYRKNGSRFMATVLISAFKDESGAVLNHFMSWLDVTRRVDAEDEIAELKAARAALRESEERQAFLLMIGDALREEPIAERKIEIAARLLGERLRASRVLRGEYDWDDNLAYIFNGWFADGAQPFPTVMQLAAYESEVLNSLRAGRTVRVDNVGALAEVPAYAAIAAVGVQALLSPPLLLNEVLKVNLSIHQDEPRHWTDGEVELVEEVAERLRAEVVRGRAEAALRESERHAQTLLAELQHRVRNTLAVVRSMARRTAENCESAEDMLAHFQGRLDAFSRVQAALTRNPDAQVDLKSLIEDELVAHAVRDGEQVQIKGPEVLLDARSAERLSLAIHELATNAVKHGALTNDRGRIKVGWRTKEADGGEQLSLRWIESGVAIEPNSSNRDGFGMELLLRSLPYDLQGETTVELTPDGLQFELHMPLTPCERFMKTAQGG